MKSRRANDNFYGKKMYGKCIIFLEEGVLQV